MKKLLHYIPLLLIFVFFSVNGFTQVLDTTKQNSEHPLLDKYYPRPKTDPIPKNPVVKSTGVEQKTVIATPKKMPQPIEEKRLTFPTLCIAFPFGLKSVPGPSPTTPTSTASPTPANRSSSGPASDTVAEAVMKTGSAP